MALSSAAILLVMAIVQMAVAGYASEHEILTYSFWEARVVMMISGVLAAMLFFTGIMGLVATQSKHRGCMIGFECVVLLLFLAQMVSGVFIMNRTSDEELLVYGEGELKTSYLSMVREVNEGGPRAESAKHALIRVSTDGQCCGYDSATELEQLVEMMAAQCAGYGSKAGAAIPTCKDAFLNVVSDGIKPFGVALISLASIQVFFLFVVPCILVFRFQCDNCDMHMLPQHHNHVAVGKWMSSN